MVVKIRKKYGFITLFIWLILVALFMALSQIANIEILFVLWLIGLLVILELIDPPFANPEYIRYLKYVAFAGVIVFGAIVMAKVMEILG